MLPALNASGDLLGAQPRNDECLDERRARATQEEGQSGREKDLMLGHGREGTSAVPEADAAFDLRLNMA